MQVYITLWMAASFVAGCGIGIIAVRRNVLRMTRWNAGGWLIGAALVMALMLLFIGRPAFGS